MNRPELVQFRSRLDKSAVPFRYANIIGIFIATIVVAFVLDLTEQKRAEAEARQSEQRYREVEMALAHANRVATMGQLTASIRP